MTLQPREEHPHGLTDKEFDTLFTTDKPILFAYHGYPWLIHRLTYRRTNHRNLHVRGYKEEGTTTTPFDMVVRNDLDRFHLVNDVIDRVPGLADPRGLHQAGAPGQADRAPAVHHAPRRGHARGAGLDVAVLVPRPGGGYPRAGEEKTRAMRARASSWIFRRWSAPRKLSAYSL